MRLCNCILLHQALLLTGNSTDGSGTTTNDSSTNGNVSSAFTGNTTWAIGKYGSALNFDEQMMWPSCWKQRALI